MSNYKDLDASRMDSHTFDALTAILRSGKADDANASIIEQSPEYTAEAMRLAAQAAAAHTAALEKKVADLEALVKAKESVG